VTSEIIAPRREKTDDVGKSKCSYMTALAVCREAILRRPVRTFFGFSQQLLIQVPEPRGTPKTGHTWTPENRPMR
jgi:hypothetical protein